MSKREREKDYSMETANSQDLSDCLDYQEHLCQLTKKQIRKLYESLDYFITDSMLSDHHKEAYEGDGGSLEHLGILDKYKTLNRRMEMYAEDLIRINLLIKNIIDSEDEN